jgi:hypothetical protein
MESDGDILPFLPTFTFTCEAMYAVEAITAEDKYQIADNLLEELLNVGSSVI